MWKGWTLEAKVSWRFAKKSLKKPPKKGKGGGQKIDNVGTNLDHHFDKIDVASISSDPEHIQISNIHIDTMTEACTTVQMPVQIGPNKQASLRCKVDTGAGGNVMPLHAFSKLFLRCVTTDRTPTGLRPTRTHLTAYNGSTIKQYRTLDTAIDWKLEGKNITK